MRHLKKRNKLGRTSSHRKAMLANMAASLIQYERIQTTHSKARVLRPFVEKLLTLGKRGDLHARRVALSRLRDKEATAKLFDGLAERFADRPGGYTRIVKVGNRGGDAAEMAIIEFVGTTMEEAMSSRGLEEQYEEAEAAAADASDESADSEGEA